MFMCLNVEKSLTLSHHISKFSGFRHCLSGDIMFLVVEVQDSTCFLISIIIIFSKAHDISYYKPNIFHTKTLVSTKINMVLVIRLLNSNLWIIHKKILIFSPKPPGRRRNRKTTTKTIQKLFKLHASEITWKRLMHLSNIY